MISQQQKEKYFPEQYEFVKGRRQQLENTLNELLCDYKGGSFLEIGLGPKVRIERAKLMQDMSIRYTGLDFDEICKNHASVLADQGITTVQLPFLIGAVGVFYNIPGLPAGTPAVQLSGCLLAKVFQVIAAPLSCRLPSTPKPYNGIRYHFAAPVCWDALHALIDTSAEPLARLPTPQAC